MADISNASHDHITTVTSINVQSGSGVTVGQAGNFTSSSIQRGDIAPYIQLKLCQIP
jgi:predicted RecA/RadA family phage recombinase